MIWKVLPQVSNDITVQFLHNRGIKSQKKIDEFFNPSLKHYDKDLQISGIDKALNRIKKAINEGGLIIVYGDYDVDGICGCAVLYKALTSLGAKVLPYIPHREKEGYGLSKIGLDSIYKQGASLVITVDNGIVAIEQANYAKELGLDLIVTDHHLPLDERPNAYATIHSTKMCGAAVAWCLIKGIAKRELGKELLQFVAVATITDMMPVLGLNRAFIHEGLKILNSTQNIGFLELARSSGIEIGQIGSYEIGHILGPRLNAIGRLEHAIDALRLLCTKDEKKAKQLAKLLSDTNTKRQKLTQDAVDEARVLITKNGSRKIHVLDSPNWSPGILGLIASRVCEQYYRPAIAIAVGEKVSKGSARSTGNINIVEILRSCSELLIDVGGHKGAAGFSLDNDNLEKFKKKVDTLVSNFKDENPVLEIEAEIKSQDLNKNLVKKIDAFEPFGIGNPRPLLATRGMVVSDIRAVGEGKHLKFKASSPVIPSASERSLDCIAFGMGEMKDIVSDNMILDLAYYLEINKFNGSEILQLKIKDMLF